MRNLPPVVHGCSQFQVVDEGTLDLYQNYKVCGIITSPQSPTETWTSKGTQLSHRKDHGHVNQMCAKWKSTEESTHIYFLFSLRLSPAKLTQKTRNWNRSQGGSAHLWSCTQEAKAGLLTVAWFFVFFLDRASLCSPGTRSIDQASQLSENHLPLP